MKKTTKILMILMILVGHSVSFAADCGRYRKKANLACSFDSLDWQLICSEFRSKLDSCLYDQEQEEKKQREDREKYLVQQKAKKRAEAKELRKRRALEAAKREKKLQQKKLEADLEAYNTEKKRICDSKTQTIDGYIICMQKYDQEFGRKNRLASDEVDSTSATVKDSSPVCDSVEFVDGYILCKKDGKTTMWEQDSDLVENKKEIFDGPRNATTGDFWDWNSQPSNELGQTINQK